MTNRPFSAKAREGYLQELQQEEFDLLIIGGGITGAGVARDAVLRGLKVALVEMNDFASATSSGSSKLIHGGIRYLGNYEFKLVSEAIHERELLKKLYAPFVRDLDFVFPTYKKKEPSRWKLNLGLHLYDAFSKFRAKHKNLNVTETRKHYRLLKKNNLTGSCVYTDSFSEDYRLVIELLKAAHRHGALCLSRLKVIGLNASKNQRCTTQVQDLISGKTFYIKSKTIMNCTGPFSDSLRQMLQLKKRLKLTQGVHFVIPQEKLLIDSAYVLTDNEQDRIVFVIPWNSTTYVGTTDTTVESVEEARARPEDLSYLLQFVNRYFETQMVPSDVIQSWVGVRPLIQPENAVSNSKISREHEIIEEPANVFHLLGGKITSHRLMAKEALDLLKLRFSLKACLTDSLPLQENPWIKKPLTHFDKSFGHDQEKMETTKTHPLTKSLPHTMEEVRFCIHHEMALQPLDYFRRRSSLYFEDPSSELFEKVLQIFAEELAWEETQKSQERKKFIDALDWDQAAFLKERAAS